MEGRGVAVARVVGDTRGVTRRRAALRHTLLLISVTVT